MLRAGAVLGLMSPAARATPPEFLPTRLSAMHVLEPRPIPLNLPFVGTLTPTLTPLERLGRTWMMAATDAIGGARASTAFRIPVSELGVRWAFTTASVPTLPPDPKYELRFLGVMATAASQGWETTLYEATRRNPTLHQVHKTLKALTGGGIDVREKKSGTRTRLDPKRRRPDLTQASIEAPPPATLSRRRSIPTTFRAGGGLRMRWLDPQERTSNFGKPGLTAYIQAKQLLVDDVQVSLWQLTGPTLLSRMPAERSLSARERVQHSTSLVLQVSGKEDRGAQSDARFGLEIKLPVRGRWRVGPYVDRQWQGKDTLILARSAGIELRQDASWRIPQRPGQWPLGQR